MLNLTPVFPTRSFSLNPGKQTINIVGLLLFLVAVRIGIARSIFHFDNTFVAWCINYSIIISCISYAFKKRLLFNKYYLFCLLYLCWVFGGAYRGIIYLENYWYTKQWLYGITCASLPVLTYIFSDPIKCSNILKTYNKFIFFFFIFFIIWFTEKDAFHFSLGPEYFLYGIFWIWLPKKWKWWTAFLVLSMIVIDPGARSQVIKGLLCVLFALAISINKWIPNIVIKTVPWFFFFSAVILLFLGISGKFNIFEIKGDPVSSPVVFQEGKIIDDGSGINNEALTDTRTFIYIEVITSALEHDYVLFGRTLARGNDSKAFGEASMTGELERYDNELLHLNIFTWLGLVGVILYSLIYFYASWLAAYRSQNIYISYLGIIVSFHWFFGWMEDQNLFNGMNMGLWLVISMCLSPKFREMSNIEFQIWVKSIFSSSKIDSYLLYRILRIRIIQSLIQGERRTTNTFEE